MVIHNSILTYFLGLPKVVSHMPISLEQAHLPHPLPHPLPNPNPLSLFLSFAFNH
jgi:hypothetical protein